MDITSIVGTLLGSDALTGVSKTTKTKKSDVQSVLSAALPMLLSGAKAQSEDKNTALSFAQALLTHGSNDTSDLGKFLKNVDLEDGAKIIGHLLGNDDSAVKQIAKDSGVSQNKTASILSAAAPLLMSLLGQDSGSKKSADDDNDNLEAIGKLATAVLENVDVGALIGGLFGGETGGTKTKKAAKTKKANSASDSGDLLGMLGGIVTKLLK